MYLDVLKSPFPTLARFQHLRKTNPQRVIPKNQCKNYLILFVLFTILCANIGTYQRRNKVFFNWLKGAFALFTHKIFKNPRKHRINSPRERNLPYFSIYWQKRRIFDKNPKKQLLAPQCAILPAFKASIRRKNSKKRSIKCPLKPNIRLFFLQLARFLGF